MIIFTCYFSGNRLHSLPAELSELKCLRSLDISNNKISVLPKELSEIQTLESVIVDVGQMRYPTSGLTAQSQSLFLSVLMLLLMLKITYLMKSSLVSFSPSVSWCVELKLCWFIILGRNVFSEVCSGGTEAIMKFLCAGQKCNCHQFLLDSVQCRF